MILAVNSASSNTAGVKQNNSANVNFKGTLKLLSSHSIWQNFDEISKIYRESGHCEEISAYLAKKFKNAGFSLNVKPDGTLCASRGMNKERTNAIILQAHMDMVAVAADGNIRKPIKMNIKDGWLYANDRTLGADDGIGVAAQLAIAEDPKFKNYPLQMIVTTNEETDWAGVKNLNKHDFYGKYLINLDSEELGVITKGCAGIKKVILNEDVPMQTLNESGYKKIKLKISDVAGDHSSLVTPNYENPIKVLMAEIQAIAEAKIVSLKGGDRINSLPVSSSAEILVPSSELERVEEKLKIQLEAFKNRTAAINPKAQVSVCSEDAQLGTSYVDANYQSKLLNGLNSIPSGLISLFDDGVTRKTSQNLGVVNLEGSKVELQVMGRSSDLKEGFELGQKTKQVISDTFGKEINLLKDSSIWQPRENTYLQQIASDAYASVVGEKAHIDIVHGGLECGAFVDMKPDLDAISVGPLIERPHTSNERLRIATVLPFYNWLSRVLELLNK